MEQIVIYTDGYGRIINDADWRPNPFYENVTGYIKAGWGVLFLQGAGGSNSRGNFCFVLTKIIS